MWFIHSKGSTKVKIKHRHILMLFLPIFLHYWIYHLFWLGDVLFTGYCTLTKNKATIASEIGLIMHHFKGGPICSYQWRPLLSPHTAACTSCHSCQSCLGGSWWSSSWRPSLCQHCWQLAWPWGSHCFWQWEDSWCRRSPRRGGHTTHSAALEDWNNQCSSSKGASTTL